MIGFRSFCTVENNEYGGIFTTTIDFIKDIYDTLYNFFDQQLMFYVDDIDENESSEDNESSDNSDDKDGENEDSEDDNSYDSDDEDSDENSDEDSDSEEEDSDTNSNLDSDSDSDSDSDPEIDNMIQTPTTITKTKTETTNITRNKQTDEDEQQLRDDIEEIKRYGKFAKTLVSTLRENLPPEMLSKLSTFVDDNIPFEELKGVMENPDNIDNLMSPLDDFLEVD